MSEHDEQKPPPNKNGQTAGIGISIGILIGVVIGSFMDNIGAGIGIGIAIGIALGQVMMTGKKDKDNNNHK
jgi:hypothetical protein